jgi:hypothetical protein
MSLNTAMNSSIDEGKPVDMLKSGQLLAIGGSPDAGLIIQKPYFAEYVGYGSAIGGVFDLQCVTVHTLGDVQITVPADKNERQSAFQKRMDDIATMQKLCELDSPLERGISLLELLCDQFGAAQIQTIPNDVLAKLVGVLPNTIAIAWSQKGGPVAKDSLYAEELVMA